jgi:hypothetical protein
MPQSYISPRFSAIDSNGRPLVGGLLYTYINTTTTPQATYQDAAGLAANTNPIILDARGEAVIFLTDGVTYTFELRDSNGALVWTQDDIIGESGGGSGGITVVTALPDSDIGVVYLPGRGLFYWGGAGYVSDYQNGFGSGAYSDRNKIINGCFRVWQRNTTFGPLTAASGNPYTADRWRISLGGTASATVTQQAAGSDYGPDRVGAISARVTSNAASSPGAADKNRFSQAIEGKNLLALALGSLWGGSFTLGFWVKASIAGTYSVAFLNGGSPGYRAYIANYTVNSANAWEFKAVTVPIDQSGTANWNRTNGIGLNVVFDLGSGANSEGAANTWLSTESTRTTGSMQMLATNNATWELSKVQLEFGSVATPFVDRLIDKELSSCERYYESSYSTGVVPGTVTLAGAYQGAIATAFLLGGATAFFQADKRAAPTMSLYAPNSAGVGAAVSEYNPGGTFVANRSANAVNIGEKSFAIQGAGSLTPGNYINAHWVAEAEL